MRTMSLIEVRRAIDEPRMQELVRAAYFRSRELPSIVVIEDGTEHLLDAILDPAVDDVELHVPGIRYWIEPGEKALCEAACHSEMVVAHSDSFCRLLTRSTIPYCSPSEALERLQAEEDSISLPGPSRRDFGGRVSTERAGGSVEKTSRQTGGG